MTPILELARLCIPVREEHYRRFDAMCVLLIVERETRVVAWTGLKAVFN